MTGPVPRRRSAPAVASPVRRSVLVDDAFVLMIEAAIGDLDLAGWLAGRRDEVIADLDRYGAISSAASRWRTRTTSAARPHH